MALRRPQDPGRNRVLVAVVILLLAIALVAGFLLGQHAAYSGMGIDPERYRALELELPEVRGQVATLGGELEAARTRQEVDRRSLELVRREIAAQKEQIASLEEGLGFYQSLMSPGEIARGLSLRAPELVARAQPGRFAWRLVVQQEARKHALIKGEMQADVYGLQDGEPVSYSLPELSEDGADGTMSLRFRYFQALEGELVLPPGFQPAGIRVVATASSPRKSEVRVQFPWQVQERFSHVGK